MSIHIENKKIIMEYNKSICARNLKNIDNIISRYYHDDVEYNNVQPFNEIKGKDNVIEKFYKPLLCSFPDMIKSVDVHIAGVDPVFPLDNWVLSSGNYIGTFEKNFIDIPSNGKCVWIRYLEFNRVVDGKIAQTFTIMDILDLMRQVGIQFIKAPTSEIIIPGPATHDAIIMGESDVKQTEKTYKLMHDMIYVGLDSFEDNGFEHMGMERYWDENFVWYGPCGIGTTYGIKGFQRYHQVPFLTSVPDRKGPDRIPENKNSIFIADGKYSALICWTEFSATHTGSEWLGMPATSKRIIMRDADIYRREGDKLIENWCQMDVIDVLLQMGVDVFDRLRKKKSYFL